MEEETNFMSEMANRLMKTWTEVGTQTLTSWFDLMELAICHPVVDSKLELEFMTQRFVGYQQLQLRLLKLSFNVWQDLLLKFESGEDWQQPLSEHSQKLRNQVEEFFTGTLKNNQDTTELWQIYLKEMQQFNQLWGNVSGASVEPLSKAAAVSTSQPWIELNNLYWNLAYEKTLGSLVQIPLLGPGRGFNDQLMRAFDAWAKLYPTSIDYQMVLAQIQMQSFEELMQELISLAQKGEKVKDWLQFQQMWGRTADKVFEKAFCTEDNLKVRGRFLNAINHYKLCQQELMEVWMKMMNLPIRSEVDEVHKSIYDLRKEVKSLKKTLAKYEAQAQATPPDREEPPTHKGHWTTANIYEEEIGNHAAVSDQANAF